MRQGGLNWLGMLVLLGALAVTNACSDDKTTDPASDVGTATLDQGPVPDRSMFPDGYRLYSCKTPGQSCNAHDPCAINPICGSDNKCRPQSLMNCKDDLECTVDTCAGLGICSNKPKAGTCKLGVRIGGPPQDGGADGGADAGAPSVDWGVAKTVWRCFKKGDKHPNDPCLVCQPGGDDSGVKGDPTKWTQASGGSCDDNDPCTRNDYCQSGVCKGTSYRALCDDGIACTVDVCDGKGGCLGNKLKSNFCFINGSCYIAKAAHPSGKCLTCDPAKNQADWTSITNTCMIGAKCYAKGAKNPAGCGECDPATSTTVWSIKGTSCCLIGGTAYKSGTKDTTGCSVCNPTKSTTAWSPVPNTCKISGKCYAKGGKNPAGCGECDPSSSATDWTVKKGGTCCLIGGKGYTSGAKDSTGCSVCDPTKSATAWSPVPNTCKISGKCYAGGATNPAGCGTCDPTTSQTAWTVKKGGTCCLIKGVVYKSAAKDTAGCATCDPSKDPMGWTPIANMCKISGTCYKSGIKHPGGCAECKPATSATAWTVTKTGYCVAGGKCYPLCNGKCVDLGSSATNCGTCGTKCTSGKVCKKGKCVVPCTVTADFETGAWSSVWTKKSGTKGTISKSYAHDGTYGAADMGWMYQTTYKTGNKGEKYTAWSKPASSGRTYLGFAATSSGCKSLVMARNTSSLMFQDNASWSYSEKTSATMTYSVKWYKMEVEFLGVGKVKGTLYDSDGKTVLKTITHDFGTSLVGGTAIRAFGTHYVDTMQFCQ